MPALGNLAAALAATLLSIIFAAPAGAASTTRDVNGDGVGDVVYTGPSDIPRNHVAVLVLGARVRAAPAAAAARVVRITTQQQIESASIIGDVNGDQLADILVATVEFRDIQELRQTYVIFGSREPKSLVLSKALFANGVAGIALEPGDAAGAGDVNGDGLADVIASSSPADPTARVLFGASQNPLTTGFPIQHHGIDADGITIFGVFGAGDTNGDGLDDVGLIVPDPRSGHGFDTDTGNWSLFVVWGRRETSPVTASNPSIAHARVTAAGRPAGRFIAHDRACKCAASTVVPVGDVTGDRRGELGVVWTKETRARLDIVFGSRSSHPATLSGNASSSSLAATFTGARIDELFAAPGDLNRDGRGDLLITPGPTARFEGLHLISGRAVRGAHRVPSAKPRVSGAYVFDLQPAGDFDADGHADMLVGYAATLANGDTGPGHYTIMYGANPLGPVGLAALGPKGTPLPALR